MERRTVNVHIAGQSYRIVTSATDEVLRKLADIVTERVRHVTPPGRMVTPQAMLLAAMSLAHEVEGERERRLALENRSRDVMERVLTRLDAALELDAEDSLG